MRYIVLMKKESSGRMPDVITTDDGRAYLSDERKGTERLADQLTEKSIILIQKELRQQES